MRSQRRESDNSQLSMFELKPVKNVGQNLGDVFRRLYFFLYSNSKASRAERIVEDLSLLLLLKLAVEANGGRKKVEYFLKKEGQSSEMLLPILRQAYPRLVDVRQRFSIGDDALRTSLKELESISLSDAPAHVLGDAFQALIGPRLRGDKGQFFTPRSVVRAMVEILAPKPEESVLDPACGTGGFLLEAHAFQSAEGIATGRLEGIDKDNDLYRLSSALLQIATKGRAEVNNFNSLDESSWESAHGDGKTKNKLFDVILTNPPFGAKIGITDRRILQEFALAKQWVSPKSGGEWIQTGTLMTVQAPQVLFLELCVKMLVPGGRMGIVLPEGLFGNKSDGYVWQWLRSEGTVMALLDCPRTTFQPGTDTKTNILFFKKGLGGGTSRGKAFELVKIAVALNCGHDRRGRTHFPNGQEYPNDFTEIARAYHANEAGPGHWKNVSLPIGAYMVPRYYAEEKPSTAFEARLTSEAKSKTLKQLVDEGVLEIRKGHEVGSEAYGTGEVPFVRTSDLSNQEISTDPTKSVAEDIYAQFAPQQRLKPDDILMVVDGRYRIGTTAILTEMSYRCVVQSHIRIISVLKPNILDPFELLFALNLASVRRRIRDLVFVQSTLGTLGRRLYELKIPVLHSDGPWREQVDHFRTVSRERGRLLNELKSMADVPYEL